MGSCDGGKTFAVNDKSIYNPNNYRNKWRFDSDGFKVHLTNPR